MLDQSLLKLVLAGIILIIAFRFVCNRNKNYQYTEGYAPYDIQHQTPPPGSQGVSKTLPTRPPSHQGPISVSTDLLPKSPPPVVNDFSEFAPRMLTSTSFLDPTKYIGLDTVGSSLKNPNYSLRSDPPIPRREVGAWQNSTIDPDLLRKSLDC
jgi:hypothetical protein